MELSGVAITLNDIFLHIQEKNLSPVMRVICGLFSVTIWIDTKGCTVERNRTSVTAAIRTFHGQTGC